MKLTRIEPVLGALLILLISPLCFGQFDSATVLGVVTDPSSAVIVGGKVQLENIETGVTDSAVTDANGLYRFLDVRIGKYRVRAEAKGFKQGQTADFAVTVNARQRVDIGLQIGETTESIVVQDAAAAVETDSSNRGQVIPHEIISNLPLNGRSYADLTLLAPGIRHSILGNMSNRDAAYNVNGMRSAFNNFILDGVDNNAYGTSNQGFSYQVIQASPDAVQEFRLDTNNYSAEYGRAAGAVINASVRSGTNDFRGSAWEYGRNTVLNAVGFFQPVGGQKPVLQQNQFGGALGGPIRKEKLFFFSDYEGTRIVSRTISYLTLPTPDQKTGKIGIPIKNPSTGAIYSDGVIPSNQITAFANHVLGDLPDPNLAGTSNNYQAMPRVGTQSDKGDARIDYYVNNKLTLFGRVSIRLANQGTASSLPGDSGSGGNVFRTYNRGIALGGTWTINPKSMLEIRFGLTRMEGSDIKNWEADSTPGMLAKYGISGLPENKPLASGLNGQAVTGYSSFGHDNGQHQFPEVINPKVNYSRLRGKHTLKMGVEYQRIATEIVDFNPMIGKDTYAGQFSKPKGASSNNLFNLSDFMFGARDSYQLNSYGLLNYRQKMYFAYLQDDFKVGRNLTLNLGLRYEYGTPQYDENNRMSNFDPNTNSLIMAKDGSIADRSLQNPDKGNWGPRFGFAYSINSKTVVRGGYGISYMHFQRSGRENLLGYNGPYVVNVAVNQNPSSATCIGDQYTSCFRPTTMGYPANFAVPANFNQAVANIHYIPRDSQNTYVQSWHLTFQRQLVRDLVLDLAYVGNRGVHVFQLGDYNQARPNNPGETLGVDARRPISNFGIIQIAFNEGLSSYHALQSKIEKRFSNGFYLLHSFTWSKSIDIAPSNMEAATGDNYYLNFRNWSSNKGISNYDQPFQNTTSLFWDLPVGRGRTIGTGLPALAEMVMGGWRLTAINTVTSGLPVNFTYTPSTAASVSSLPVYRPNLIGSPVLPADQRSVSHYFDSTGLAVPDVSQPFGNVGRNIARSDSIYQLDLGIQKSFRLASENRRLEFRAEMFNALNKTNFQAPASNISNSTFGKITATFPARQVQLALKLSF